MKFPNLSLTKQKTKEEEEQKYNSTSKSSFL